MRSLFLKTIVILAGVMFVQFSYAQVPPEDNPSIPEDTSTIAAPVDTTTSAAPIDTTTIATPVDTAAVTTPVEDPTIAQDPAPVVAPLAPSLPLITIGDPENIADLSGHRPRGSVAESFQIARECVKVSDYAIMLNSVAASDPHHLYSEGMGVNGDNLIEQRDNNGQFEYVVVEGKENEPMTQVSFLSALRYCNWVHNGELQGEEDASTTEDGAYTLSSLDPLTSANLLQPNAGAKCFLPSEDQWFKAAYYVSGDHPHYDFSLRQGDDVMVVNNNLHEMTTTLYSYSGELVTNVNPKSDKYYVSSLMVDPSGNGLPSTSFLFEKDWDKGCLGVGFRIAAPVNIVNAPLPDAPVNVADDTNSTTSYIDSIHNYISSTDPLQDAGIILGVGTLGVGCYVLGPIAWTYLGLDAGWDAATTACFAAGANMKTRAGACFNNVRSYCGFSDAAKAAVVDDHVMVNAPSSVSSVEAVETADPVIAEAPKNTSLWSRFWNWCFHA